jgi:hypothetical protein
MKRENMTDLTALPQLCNWPECKRPVSPNDAERVICAEHLAYSEASTEVQEWEHALGVLRPWVESTHVIHFDKLTEGMERALREAEAGAQRAAFGLKRAKAALEE